MALKNASPRLLVGFGEALAAPEVYWSLRDAGFETTFYFRKGKRSSARSLRGMRVLEVTAPETHAARFVEDIIVACEQHGPFDGVMPLEDASLLLLHDASLAVPFLGPRGPQAAIAIDKAEQFRYAEDAGFDVPGYIVVNGRGSAPSSPRGIDWNPEHPVIVKSAVIGVVAPADANAAAAGLTRPGGRYHPNAHSALDAIAGNDVLDTPWILQNVKVGVGEGVFGMSGSYGVRAISGHRRVRMMDPAGSGSSACKTRMPDEQVRACVERFCQRCQWQGLFMIELLQELETNRHWFMELNGRTWGSTALARRCGLEYPAWHVEQMLRDTVPPDLAPAREVLARDLGREFIHFLFVMRGNRKHAPSWPGRCSTIWNLIRPGSSTRWYNSDPSQRFFPLRDAISTVRSFLSR
ncbi:MAG: hypothetical protein ACR2GY_10305 [Phycisphaerales bacterium]